MLTFLWVAFRAGVEVAAYEDEAVGVMTKNEHGVLWVSTVTLRPRITYVGAPPDAETLAKFHHDAHHGCFIANSVKTEVTIEPEIA